jgi:hypothetical protein
MATNTRLNIGFKGGQVIALRVTEEQHKALLKGLGSEGWHEVESEDGPVRLDLNQVVYVSSDSPEPRVGFG